MGARDSGPKPWVKVTDDEAAIAAIFHPIDQLRGSWGSSLGWGTSTCFALLTKWWLPISAMISVPGIISVCSSSSIWRSAWDVVKYGRSRYQD